MFILLIRNMTRLLSVLAAAATVSAQQHARQLYCTSLNISAPVAGQFLDTDHDYAVSWSAGCSGVNGADALDLELYYFDSVTGLFNFVQTLAENVAAANNGWTYHTPATVPIAGAERWQFAIQVYPSPGGHSGGPLLARTGIWTMRTYIEPRKPIPEIVGGTLAAVFVISLFLCWYGWLRCKPGCCYIPVHTLLYNYIQRKKAEYRQRKIDEAKRRADAAEAARRHALYLEASKLQFGTWGTPDFVPPPAMQPGSKRSLQKKRQSKRNKAGGGGANEDDGGSGAESIGSVNNPMRGGPAPAVDEEKEGAMHAGDDAVSGAVLTDVAAAARARIQAARRASALGQGVPDEDGLYPAERAAAAAADGDGDGSFQGRHGSRLDVDQAYRGGDGAGGDDDEDGEGEDGIAVPVVAGRALAAYGYASNDITLTSNAAAHASVPATATSITVLAPAQPGNAASNGSIPERARRGSLMGMRLPPLAGHHSADASHAAASGGGDGGGDVNNLDANSTSIAIGGNIVQEPPSPRSDVEGGRLSHQPSANSRHSSGHPSPNSSFRAARLDLDAGGDSLDTHASRQQQGSKTGSRHPSAGPAGQRTPGQMAGGVLGSNPRRQPQPVTDNFLRTALGPYARTGGNIGLGVNRGGSEDEQDDDDSDDDEDEEEGAGRPRGLGIIPRGVGQQPALAFASVRGPPGGTRLPYASSQGSVSSSASGSGAADADRQRVDAIMNYGRQHTSGVAATGQMPPNAQSDGLQFLSFRDDPAVREAAREGRAGSATATRMSGLGVAPGVTASGRKLPHSVSQDVNGGPGSGLYYDSMGGGGGGSGYLDSIDSSYPPQQQLRSPSHGGQPGGPPPGAPGQGARPSSGHYSQVGGAGGGGGGRPGGLRSPYSATPSRSRAAVAGAAVIGSYGGSQG